MFSRFNRSPSPSPSHSSASTPTHLLTLPSVTISQLHSGNLIPLFTGSLVIWSTPAPSPAPASAPPSPSIIGPPSYGDATSRGGTGAPSLPPREKHPPVQSPFHTSQPSTASSSRSALAPPPSLPPRRPSSSPQSHSPSPDPSSDWLLLSVHSHSDSTSSPSSTESLLDLPLPPHLHILPLPPQRSYLLPISFKALSAYGAAASGLGIRSEKNGLDNDPRLGYYGATEDEEEEEGDNFIKLGLGDATTREEQKEWEQILARRGGGMGLVGMGLRIDNNNNNNNADADDIFGDSTGVQRPLFASPIEDPFLNASRPPIPFGGKRRVPPPPSPHSPSPTESEQTEAFFDAPQQQQHQPEQNLIPPANYDYHRGELLLVDENSGETLGALDGVPIRELGFDGDSSGGDSKAVLGGRGKGKEQAELEPVVATLPDHWGPSSSNNIPTGDEKRSTAQQQRPDEIRIEPISSSSLDSDSTSLDPSNPYHSYSTGTAYDQSRLVKLSSLVSRGIVMVGHGAGKVLETGANKWVENDQLRYQGRIARGDIPQPGKGSGMGTEVVRQPMVFKDSTKKNVAMVSQGAGKVVQVSGKVLGVIGDVASKAGDRLGKSTGIQMQRHGHGGEGGKPQGGIKGTVGKGLVAFGNVTDGIGKGWVGATSGAANAGETVVAHRYGNDAGVMARQVGGVVRNVVLVYVDMRGVVRKVILKSVAKSAIMARTADGQEVMLSSNATTPTAEASSSGSYSHHQPHP